MRAVGPEGVQPRDVEVRQDVQQQDGGGPLSVRRVFQQVAALIGAGDGIAQGAGSVGEILQRMLAAEGAQRGDHVGGHLALIEPRAALFGDAAQRLCLLRRTEDLAFARGLSPHQQRVARGPLQAVRRLGPVAGDAGGDGDALLGIVDRGGQAGGQPQLAPVGGQAAEGVDRPRHRHRLDPPDRDRGQPLCAEGPGVQGCRGTARTVQRDHILAARRLQQHKAVAAQAGHLRLAEPQQDRPGNRRIHRVATGLEDIDRHPRRQRVRGGAHAVHGVDGRAAGFVEIAHVLPPSHLFRP